MPIDPYTSKDRLKTKRTKLLVKAGVTICPSCKREKESAVCQYCWKGKSR